MGYTTPVYYTSQIYPANVIEKLKTGGAMEHMPFYFEPLGQETMVTGADFLAGTLAPGLGSYTDGLPDEMQTGADFLAGTLINGIVTYTNWPEENIKTAADFIAGTFILGLTTYTNWPADQMKTGADLIAGTLT